MRTEGQIQRLPDIEVHGWDDHDMNTEPTVTVELVTPQDIFNIVHTILGIMVFLFLIVCGLWCHYRRLQMIEEEKLLKAGAIKGNQQKLHLASITPKLQQEEAPIRQTLLQTESETGKALESVSPSFEGIEWPPSIASTENTTQSAISRSTPSDVPTTDVWDIAEHRPGTASTVSDEEPDRRMGTGRSRLVTGETVETTGDSSDSVSTSSHAWLHEDREEAIAGAVSGTTFRRHSEEQRGRREMSGGGGNLARSRNTSPQRVVATVPRRRSPSEHSDYSSPHERRVSRPALTFTPQPWTYLSNVEGRDFGMWRSHSGGKSVSRNIAQTKHQCYAETDRHMKNLVWQVRKTHELPVNRNTSAPSPTLVNKALHTTWKENLQVNTNSSQCTSTASSQETAYESPVCRNDNFRRLADTIHQRTSSRPEETFPEISPHVIDTYPTRRVSSLRKLFSSDRSRMHPRPRVVPRSSSRESGQSVFTETPTDRVSRPPKPVDIVYPRKHSKAWDRMLSTSAESYPEQPPEYLEGAHQKEFCIPCQITHSKMCDVNPESGQSITDATPEHQVDSTRKPFRVVRSRTRSESRPRYVHRTSPDSCVDTSPTRRVLDLRKSFRHSRQKSSFRRREQTRDMPWKYKQNSTDEYRTSTRAHSVPRYVRSIPSDSCVDASPIRRVCDLQNTFSHARRKSGFKRRARSARKASNTGHPRTYSMPRYVPQSNSPDFSQSCNDQTGHTCDLRRYFRIPRQRSESRRYAVPRYPPSQICRGCGGDSFACRKAYIHRSPHSRACCAADTSSVESCVDVSPTCRPNNVWNVVSSTPAESPTESYIVEVSPGGRRTLRKTRRWARVNGRWVYRPVVAVPRHYVELGHSGRKHRTQEVAGGHMLLTQRFPGPRVTEHNRRISFRRK